MCLLVLLVGLGFELPLLCCCLDILFGCFVIWECCV